MYESVTALLCEAGWIRKQVPGLLDWGEEVSSFPTPTAVIPALALLTGSGPWCASRAGVMQEMAGERLKVA